MSEREGDCASEEEIRTKHYVSWGGKRFALYERSGPLDTPCHGMFHQKGRGQMKVADVIGAKVVRVDQSRLYDHSISQMRVIVERIVLDNGTVLIPEHISYGDRDGFAQDTASVMVVKS